MVAIRRDCPRAGVGESVEPFPEYGFSRHDSARGSHHQLVPRGSLGMILIPLLDIAIQKAVSAK